MARIMVTEENITNRGFFRIFKKFSWEDGIFVVMLAILLVLNYSLLAQLNALPSPIYGGDYYNHLGSIEHIYQGGSVFESGQMTGEMQWVPWLYHLLVADFAKLFGLAPIMGIIYFSLVVLALACTAVYLFISKFFHNKIFGLIGAAWIAQYFPIFKYTPFALYAILPIFLYAAYNFFKKKDYPSAILFGLAFGVAGLSNTFMFIQNIFFIGFLMFYFVILRNISFENNKLNIDKKGFIDSLIKGAIVFLIGFGISLIWWYKPIFVYHAKTLNDMQIYGFPEMTTFSQMISFVWVYALYPQYFDTRVVSSILFNVLALAGAVLVWIVKNKKEERQFTIILVIAALFGLFSHFITLPLMHMLLAPASLFQLSILFANLLLFFITIEIILVYAGKIHKYAKILVLVLIALPLVYTIAHPSIAEGTWWAAGKSQIPPDLAETREWVLKSTSLNDVFLTTNEDGFALNAMTGRKVVSYRRTHASPYTDMNQRMLDAGIMLYTSNDEKRMELMKKYNVKYLYWEPGWLRMEFSFDQEGKLQGFFDPLMIEYTAERENELKTYNVTYMRTTYYLDPAWSSSFPKRDVLVVVPKRMDMEKPWSETLDAHLEIAKEINRSGQITTRIYKVKM
jgi:hypothetical protein